MHCLTTVEGDHLLAHDFSLGELEEEVLRERRERDIIVVVAASPVDGDRRIVGSVTKGETAALDLDTVPRPGWLGDLEAITFTLVGRAIETSTAAVRNADAQSEF
jgi:hypothetical protein